MEITGLLQQDAEFQQLASRLKKGGRHLMTGISGTARTVYLAALIKRVQPVVTMGLRVLRNTWIRKLSIV
ncbi:hypothetical protein H7R52_15250 [Weissella confusa]|uniref:Uncharacterized protein n=1 Tax=Weissella confusa TaxID=1583 RepID=A0A923SQ40_WEICO|nr:hypothetical protein [Weissella confusa]